MKHPKGIRRACSALLVGGLLCTLGAPALAQQPPPPPSLGLQDVAKATALSVQIAPTVGRLALAIKVGTSVAEIRNRLAQSQSDTVDLGLLGGAITGEGCDGNATIKESDLPQPLRVDNRDGDAEAQSSEADPAAGTGQVLRQIVRATGQPMAQADTTTLAGEFGLIQLEGGQTIATVEVVDGGAARVAHAVTQFDVIIPGAVTLSGLRWEAFHRTGSEPNAFATFTIGAAEVLGQAVPLQDLPAADALAQINTLLEPLGIQLGVPVIERFTEPADLVRVTPLVIRTAPSELRSLILGPVLENSRELRDTLSNALIEASCDLASAVLVAEVLLGQVSGIGTTSLSIGGAEALTGQVDAGEGLGEIVDDVPLPGDDPGPAPTSGGTPATPGQGPRVTTPGTLPRPVTGPANPSTAPIGSFERICESVHPFRRPDCSVGIGPFVGIGGILAALAFGAFDWQHQLRGRRRLVGDEVDA